MAYEATLGHRDNRLLAALPYETFEAMGRDLRQISFTEGKSLYEPGEPIEEVYFPQSGMISLLVVSKDGDAIEATTVGREGAVGLQSALGKRISFTRATTQISGKFSVIRAAAFAHVAQAHEPLRDLIARYTEVLWAEAQQIAACNASHDAAARLCRWLLQCADRIGSNNLPLTQELIGQMLGIRRTTVTLMAQTLQSNGAITYRRGRLVILDREKLEQRACECYEAMQQEKLPHKLGVKL
jgi:CRP-like cAMP-binding protein